MPEPVAAPPLPEEGFYNFGTVVPAPDFTGAVLAQGKTDLLFANWRELRPTLPESSLSRLRRVALLRAPASDTEAWLYWDPAGKTVRPCCRALLERC